MFLLHARQRDRVASWLRLCATVLALEWSVGCTGRVGEATGYEPLGTADSGVMPAPTSLAREIGSAPPSSAVIRKMSLDVTRPPKPSVVSARIFGLGLIPTRQVRTYDEDVRKRLGAHLLRFPGGYHGDGYSPWENYLAFDIQSQVYRAATLTMPELFAYASEMGADLLYQMNISTKLNKRNAAGWLPLYPPDATEEARRTRLWADAARVIGEHKGQFKYVQLGNEQWDSWTPSEYIAEATWFAQKLKNDAEGGDSSLRVILVGHPTTGGNQADAETPEANDIAWTQAVQAALRTTKAACGGKPCFDLVSDHPYVWTGYNPFADNFGRGNFKGMAAFYPLANYAKIFAQRKADYGSLGAGRAITEWNLKCWGESPVPLTVPNANFEKGTEGWGDVWPPVSSLESATRSVVHVADRPGSVLRLWAGGPRTGSIPFVQTQATRLVRADGVALKSRKVMARGWLKTNAPQYVSVVLQQANPKSATEVGNQYRDISAGSMAQVLPNQWQGFSVGNVPAFPDTAEIQLTLRITKTAAQWATDPSPVEVLFDDLEVLDTTGVSFRMSAGSTTEHGFFVFETLMQMAQHEVELAAYHTLSANGGQDCAVFASGASPGSFQLNPQGQAFAAASALASATLLQTTLRGGTAFHIPENGCVSKKCLAPNVDVPFVSAYAAEKEGKVQLYLVNRHSTETGRIQLNLSAAGLATNRLTATAHYLKAATYTARSFAEVDETSPVDASDVAVFMPPLSIVRLEFKP